VGHFSRHSVVCYFRSVSAHNFAKEDVLSNPLWSGTRAGEQDRERCGWCYWADTESCCL